MGRSATIYGIITGIGLVSAAAAWGGDTIDLTKGWRFAPDPNQEGVNVGACRTDWQLSRPRWVTGYRVIDGRPLGCSDRSGRFLFPPSCSRA